MQSPHADGQRDRRTDFLEGSKSLTWNYRTQTARGIGGLIFWWTPRVNGLSARCVPLLVPIGVYLALPHLEPLWIHVGLLGWSFGPQMRLIRFNLGAVFWGSRAQEPMEPKGL